MPTPTLKTVMTPFPYSVEADASADEALQFMRHHKIRHLPVIHKGALKSMVSDRDIKLMLGPDFANPERSELKVGDAMVDDCYIVDLDTPLHLVVRHMAENRIGSAIVTRRGKLAGIFTATDACRVLADCLDGGVIDDSEDDDVA